MVKMDFPRAFGRWFFLAVAINFAQYYLSQIPFMTPPYNAIQLFDAAIAFNYLNWMAPLVAALPFATSFCTDWRSRSALSQMVRSGRSRYVFSKCAFAVLSGAMVEVVSLSLLILALLAGGTVDGTREIFEFRSYFSQIIQDAHWGWYVGGVVALRALGGAFCALAGLAFSSFVPNRYFTLAFPLLLTRVSMEIQWSNPQLPEWVNLLALSEGLLRMDYWPMLGVGAAVFGTGMALCGVAFARGVRRRIEHG